MYCSLDAGNLLCYMYWWLLGLNNMKKICNNDITCDKEQLLKSTNFCISAAFSVLLKYNNLLVEFKNETKERNAFPTFFY